RMDCLVTPAYRSIPKWLYSLKSSLVHRFVDGVIKSTGTYCDNADQNTVSLCNHDLAGDFVALSDWLGYQAEVLDNGDAGDVVISRSMRPKRSPIVSVDMVGIREIFDISVA